MSYYFNTQIFLGYEFENGDIDYILDVINGEFLYIGRSLSHADEDDRAGATELPLLTATDYTELKEKLCKESLLKDLIGDKMPKLYHVYYYN